MSATPFRPCDFKTIGANPFCELGVAEDDQNDIAMVSPPMWGASVLETYREVGSRMTMILYQIKLDF